MVKQIITFTAFCLAIHAGARAEVWRQVAMQSEDDGVAPMTGLVFWSTHAHAQSDAIQLEFSYMLYNDVVDADGHYDWSSVDALLDDIASRGHQAILRFRFIYPGYAETAVPDSIKKLPDYREVIALSEGKKTAFCDWSSPELQDFVLEFHTHFAERYDQDPRLAFIQTGFGLWAEYHIYDGPMELGKTFPSKAYQAEFLQHMDMVYQHTPWAISIDAAEHTRTPFAENAELKGLGFGVFDDSFMHEQHSGYNETCWDFFGRDRWQANPVGGEFSYYTAHDQENALSDHGPHGESFAQAAKRFNISYMFANNQTSYQSLDKIKLAGRSTGYRFVVTDFVTNGLESKVVVANQGVAPIYYDAYPSLGDVRSEQSLRGLLPGQSREFLIAASADSGDFNIACDRLVPGQAIPYSAALVGP